MLKQEIYDYLLKNKFKLFNRKNGVLNIKTHPIFNEINYDFLDAEDLYNYLKETPEELLKCKYHSCNNKRKFKSFTFGYRDFCCDSCRNKWLSESRTGKNNPIHRISDENRIKWKSTLSQQVRQRIREGKWTPEITNSWCHSRYKISFTRNNENINQNVRSSWEAFFQLLNKDYEYEKLRIPYFYNNQWHSYIVDFINNDIRKVVEIKPISEKTKSLNRIKKDALLQWCIDNNFTYMSIDENYFKRIIWNDSLLDGQPDKDRLIKFKKYFYEN